MNHTTILNRIMVAINNLEEYDNPEKYTTIVEDLHYIYFQLETDAKSMSNTEQFQCRVQIEEKVLEYFAILTKKFMKFNYDKDIIIINSSDASLMMASAGYDSKSDIIKYTPFGLILNKKNRSSCIQTFLHESRHKMQHDVYKTINIKDILRFKGNSILLVKEEIYGNFNTDNNRQFYRENYDSLYTETDAEEFSLKEINNLILPLYTNYIIYCSNNGIKITDELVEKTTNIHQKIQQDSYEIECEQKEQGRLKNNIISELSGEQPISSTYNVESIEVDKLIELDKTIKNHPELQEEYPFLKLLFNGNTPKTYEEINEDKQKLLNTYPGYEYSINKLYDSIIMTDPILYLTDLVLKQEIDKIVRFIEKHPAIFDEYPNEINNLCSLSNNYAINTILTSNNKNRTKK